MGTRLHCILKYLFKTRKIATHCIARLGGNNELNIKYKLLGLDRQCVAFESNVRILSTNCTINFVLGEKKNHSKRFQAFVVLFFVIKCL